MTGRRHGGPASFDRDFDAAFDSLAAIAYRVSFRVLGDQAEAEDITQETLARALVRWRRIAGYAEAWTARTATNLAIGSWRRRTRPARLPLMHDAVPEALPLNRIELVTFLKDDV